jgi:phosphatidate cytidylyltransferase
MTGRSRRGVKFSHNNKHSNGQDGRRASFSDVSEEGSPNKARSSGTLENIQEVIPLVPDRRTRISELMIVTAETPYP